MSAKIKNFLSMIIAFEDDIFDDDDHDKTKQAIESYLREERISIKSKFNRQVMIDELMIIHNQLAGSTAQHLQELYFLFQFDRDAYRKLKSFNWLKKARGIHELARMNVSKYSKRILSYTNHPNPHLRMEAQMGYIQIHPEAPFNFLSLVDEEISEWHQLNLFATFSQSKRTIIPSFRQWLNSDNEYVIAFCLKMVTHYNQLEAIPDLVALLKHEDITIRCAAIYALQKLETESCVVELMELFYKDEAEVQVAIIKNLGGIRSEVAKPFLQQLLYHEDFTLALAAAQALYEYYGWGEEYLRELLVDADERTQSILMHALDERI